MVKVPSSSGSAKKNSPVRRRSARAAKKETSFSNEDKLFRLLGIILFTFLLIPVYWLFIFLVALQYIIVLVENKPNDELKFFSNSLKAYVIQTLDYMSFSNDTLPFPFSPFPKG